MSRPPIAQTITALIGVAILIALGTWQVQRLHWKESIIATLETLYNDPRQQNLIAMLRTVNDGDAAFGYGIIRGRLLKDKAILLGPRINDGRSGYNLLIPLKIPDGAVIVDAGWVDDLWSDTLEERLAALPLDVKVRGLVRMPDFSSLVSKNSPKNNLWFRPDPKEIAAVKDLEDAYSNVILYADSFDPPLQDVLPHKEKWLPRNKHLQYALFWYAMAAALMAVYGLYWRSRKD